MADKTFADLTAATTLADGDLFAIENISNNSRKITALNAGMASGSSFPTPASGLRYYRTDRNIEYVYDGTRWLSTQLFVAEFPERNDGDYTATAAAGRITNLWYGGFDIFVEDAVFTWDSTGSGNWTFGVFGLPTGASVSLFDTGGKAVSGREVASVAAIDTVVAASSNYLEYQLVATENSGTASIRFVTCAFNYRLVG